MIYRESGQFKTSYAADQALFPIRQDRIAVFGFLALAFLVVPFVINDYWANAILLPFLIFGLAALGLNILTGYCGQVSLGSGAFMAVGAYTAYKLMTAFPELSMVIVVLLSGLSAAGTGVLFGLPSLRIKGFYLAVATLAAQFFLIWLFNRVGWFYNDSPTGQISAPTRTIFGRDLTGPAAEPWVTYLFCLAFVAVSTLVAKNIVRGRIGRMWMAIRDMDVAAELIGVRPLTAKLSAFAVSSFYIGMSGALFFAVWRGAAEAGEAFGIERSFLILFMIIIGGLGSILGSYLGAAFIVLLPIFLKFLMVDTLGLMAVTAKHVETTAMGALIILFLVLEPHGLNRIWQTTKDKLRLWPFPH